MKKAKRVMIRAWEIAKEAVVNFGGRAIEYISEALKMAWAEVKEVRYTREQLEDMGAKRWSKAGYDRLYLNAAGVKIAGLEVSRYNTGNISSASFNGQSISNTKARNIIGFLEKAFIDLTTGKVFCNQAKDEEIQEVIEALKNNLKLM